MSEPREDGYLFLALSAFALALILLLAWRF
jgi:hypothetical protein